ncbi:MAG: hypothetical protein JWM33_2613 [Caulobacteraceae bacterium]|nr:hypothetical protein [Caulobacteraceae bacterium]
MKNKIISTALLGVLAISSLALPSAASAEDFTVFIDMDGGLHGDYSIVDYNEEDTLWVSWGYWGECSGYSDNGTSFYGVMWAGCGGSWLEYVEGEGWGLC